MPFFVETLTETLWRKSVLKDRVNTSLLFLSFPVLRLSIFNRMTNCRLTEREKVDPILRNLHTEYVKALALSDIETIAELINLCKKLGNSFLTSIDLAKINLRSLVQDRQRKQTKKMKQLHANTPYPGLYGVQVVLNLQDQAIYLPNRVTEVYKKNLDHFTSHKYSIIYRGEVDCGSTEPLQSFEIIET
nr:unnamed protein product [Callosobruchus chinensis]